jgi:hypothetical protein
MAEQGRRLSVAEAVEVIKRFLSIIRGPALSILIEAKDSGKVQTFGDAGRDWWKIDPETELVTDTSGVYQMVVMLDCHDLSYWLESNRDRLVQEYRPAAARDPVEGEAQTVPCDAPAQNAREPSRGRPGRKPRSGSIDDEAALRRMLHLLAAGNEASVLAAAKAVATERKPNQSVEADIARLRRKFANRWGTEPPPGKTWADVERELKTN